MIWPRFIPNILQFGAPGIRWHLTAPKPTLAAAIERRLVRMPQVE